ncbi:hypothetical protein EHQ68_16725 [Leptospira congkakensis]|uniref:Uncharacterized protein n=1 Tax=Leptospira congkakensis TaxID=2484932 RepID=A0A8B5NBT7_9LEPT|nr:hypothetical protein [Leptospira congkakensis]TGL85756.1 hypothetical protein EHQ68_16725 [Leptospira congkakensis]TGL97055.1 hypothetical protein EHQ69_00065 [Leptospira congkakensis]
MSNSTKSIYKDQLPNPDKVNFEKIFNYFAGAASVIAFLMLWKDLFANDTKIFIFIAYLIFQNISIIIYLIYKSMGKEKRFAQSIYYLHYINHSIRDSISDFLKTKQKQKKESLVDILDAVAECFSLLCSTKCRVTIKQLNDKMELEMVARNSTSLQTKENKFTSSHIHKLSDNTDFYNLWYSIDGCSRYYLCNNLKNEFKQLRYKNSSFSLKGGEPKIKDILGFFTYIENWNLSYRSTLVIPIRYIADYDPPENHVEISPNWDYFGFLCIDANKKNVFDTRYAPEVGAAVADVLFTYFRTISSIETQENQNESH